MKNDYNEVAHVNCACSATKGDYTKKKCKDPIQCLIRCANVGSLYRFFVFVSGKPINNSKEDSGKRVNKGTTSV